MTETRVWLVISGILESGNIHVNNSYQKCMKCKHDFVTEWEKTGG